MQYLVVGVHGPLEEGLEILHCVDGGLSLGEHHFLGQPAPLPDETKLFDLGSEINSDRRHIC